MAAARMIIAAIRASLTNKSCGQLRKSLRIMLRAAKPGEVLFKLRDIRAETEGAIIERARNGGIKLLADRANLRRQIKVRDGTVNVGHFKFLNSQFGFLSGFGFRHSDFVTP